MPGIQSAYHWTQAYDSSILGMSSQQLASVEHPVSKEDNIVTEHGIKYKVVKFFRVKDIDMAIITEYRTTRPMDQRLFFIKKHNKDNNSVVEGLLPIELQAVYFGTINHAVKEARRILSNA